MNSTNEGKETMEMETVEVQLETTKARPAKTEEIKDAEVVADSTSTTMEKLAEMVAPMVDAEKSADTGMAMRMNVGMPGEPNTAKRRAARRRQRQARKLQRNIRKGRAS